MTKRRFAEVSEDDIEKSRSTSYAKKTAYNTSSHNALLLQFYNSTASGSDKPTFSEIDRQTLNTVLEKFYLGCRKTDGGDFKSSTYTTMRQNIRRAVLQSHKCDILTDPEFASSNRVFCNKMKLLKAAGKGFVEHHADIGDNDLKKVVSELSPDDPDQLQLLVWFYLQLYFCRRGIENQTQLKKDHYIVREINGQKCIVQKTDELTKNHREQDTNRANGFIIPSQNCEKCPVAHLKVHSQVTTVFENL